MPTVPPKLGILKGVTIQGRRRPTSDSDKQLSCPSPKPNLRITSARVLMVNLEQGLWHRCRFVVISVDENTWQTNHWWLESHGASQDWELGESSEQNGLKGGVISVLVNSTTVGKQDCKKRIGRSLRPTRELFSSGKETKARF